LPEKLVIWPFVKLLMKVGRDRNNKDPRVTVVIAKAVPAALLLSLLSLTLDFGEMTRRDV